MIIDSPTSPWRATGSSVRGASHVRASLENQDAIGWIPTDGAGVQVALSVADGHGSPRSFRSATGAELAVKVSQQLAAELLEVDPTGGQISVVKDRLLEEVPKRIVQEWRARVEDHLARHPFSEEELTSVERRIGENPCDFLERDPYIAYGSTLVTAIALESFMVFWQVGDGDVLAVSAQGVGRPITKQTLLIANETTSLCSKDAWQYFQVAVLGTPPPLVTVSTDGLANSFLDEQGFCKFGSDLFELIARNGLEDVSQKMNDWLQQMTEEGSGDDISLGVICRSAALTS